MKERYFITGGTGFVGANIVRTLVQNKKHVALLVRDRKLNWRLSDIRSKLTIYESDIEKTDFAAIFAKEKPTIIFHLAAYGAMPKEDNLDTMVETNVIALVRLLQTVQNCRSVRLFVNTGSSSEYGVKEQKMRETDAPCPVNDYGVSKAAATLYCQKFSVHSTCSVVTLRLFSPYGYFEQSTRFIPSVISCGLDNKPMSASSKTFVRDFIFIEDVVQAYMKTVLMNSKKLNGQIINIGSGKQYTLGSVVHTVESLFSMPLNISWNSSIKQQRQVEPSMWEADISKAEKLLRWSPKYSLAEGLKKTIEWRKKSNI